MTRKLALIPVDARPVTYDLPKELAQIAGWEIITPPKECLGFLKEPADFIKLFQWIEQVSEQVEGMIVSIDMILYGGLVPSRINVDDDKIILERLATLLEIKKKNPSLKLMAFSSTMRLSNSYVNEEEKEYWAEFGKEIWTYSYHYHKYQKQQLNEDQAIVTEMKTKIPSWILEDYKQSRNRNFQINISLIEYVQQELLDLLVFPQDDTSEYGFNILEQEMLQEQICNNNLYDRIYIYPGADEVASVLTARLIYLLEQEKYPTFYPIYSGMKGSLAIARYEDRSIRNSVIGQIHAIGGHTVDEPSEAAIILGINVPGRVQGDLALQVQLNEVNTNDRHIGEWLKKLRYYFEKGKPLAIVDVAYANGADAVMIAQLFSIFSIRELSGFAAWNTAGNTIGTVVAQAALSHLAEKQKKNTSQVKNRQLMSRLLDDYLYQSIVRQEVREFIDEEMISKDILLEKVTHLFLERACLLIEQMNVDCTIERIYLPWDRTFEIGIELQSTY